MNTTDTNSEQRDCGKALKVNIGDFLSSLPGYIQCLNSSVCFVLPALFLLLFSVLASNAQAGPIVALPDYQNQIYTNAPTNALATNLTQTASVAFYSGSISSLTNSPPTLADAPAPTDGTNYLVQSVIGQPIGGVPFAFYLPGVTLLGPTNGAVFTAPANIALNAQAWQLAFDEYVQRVDFYASGATNGLIATVTNAQLGTNMFTNIWTDDVPGTCAITAVATDNLGGCVTSAVVNISVVAVILVNGQSTNTHNFTFLMTNPPVITMTNPFGGEILYNMTTDGSTPPDPLNPDSVGFPYNGPFTNYSSVTIRAGITDSNGITEAEPDTVSITITPMYTLTASTAGGGSVTPTSGFYTNNSVVTLTATASNNWSFLNWAGGGVTNTNTTFMLTINSNTAVQAVFGTSLFVQETNGLVQVSTNQSVYPQLGGSVQISPNQSVYPYGSNVLLTAITSASNYFYAWSLSAGIGGSNSPFNFAVTSAVPTVEAQFVHIPTTNQFSLTIKIGSGTGSATPFPYATLYTNGASVTVTATPSNGQSFLNWSSNASGNANPLPLTINSNMTIVANFSTNIPPAIAITNPANGTAVTWPTNISIGVAVSNTIGTVTNVSFLSGTNQIGVVTNAPFSFVWSNAAVGTNILTAVAYATTGLFATSDPVTNIVDPPPPGFAFSSPSYAVNEADGSVTLTVVNGGGLAGTVSYQTVDGTAYGGSGFSGSYMTVGGSLTFNNGQFSSNLTISIIDNYLDSSNIQFQVVLYNPTVGALGGLSNTIVTIYLNDPGGATNSLLTTGAPSLPQPLMNSQLTVMLTPTNAGGQWRFPWDQAWRNSGDTVTGLVAGNYPINFRNVPNYLPFPPTLIVGVTNAANAIGYYYPTIDSVATNSPGSLTVSFTGAGGGGGWNFVGETNWFPSGFTTNLLPDTYFIQFEPVNGWMRPNSQAVQVTGGASNSISEAYLLPGTPPATSFPNPVPPRNITNDYYYPYQFNGQLQTDAGFGSGVAVRQNIVLTAAHMVFNDQTQSFVSQAFWDFQEEAGAFQPEPLQARGSYVLSGYAAQRIYDLTNTINQYGPGNSSPQSQDLDVAALYFLAPVARGGYGGYLASDVVPNPWLTSGTLQKMLVGYPVDGSEYGTSIVPDTMYATTPQTAAFMQETDQVYTTASFLSYPGNSGGPVYVQLGTNWFPAAVYLGTSGTGQSSVSIMRAIDSNVVNLINQAAALGDAGTNHNGGVITVSVTGTASNPGLLEVTIEPWAAFNVYGCASQLSTDQQYQVANPSAWSLTSSVFVQFNSPNGWNAPPNQSISVAAGATLNITGLYTLALSFPSVITYGTTLPGATTVITPHINGSADSTPYSPGTVLSAGTYPLAVSFTPSDTNYGGTVTTNVSLSVSPASLTVTAANTNRPYGQVNPPFTGTTNGLQNGDTITATYSTSATASSSVGTYPIVPSLVNSNQPNYTVTLVNGTLTVTVAPLTVTAHNASRPYGSNNPTFAAPTFSGQRNGDNISATASAPSVTSSSPPGIYTNAIIPTVNPTSPLSLINNYQVTLVPGTLIVTGSPPSIQSGQISGGMFTVTWSAISGAVYEIQSTPSLAPAAWTNFGGNITATNSTMAVSQAIGTNTRHFYRVVLLP